MKVSLARHRATTAQACAVYPFAASAPLPAVGPYLGTDLTARGAPFHFDPFAAYRAGLVTNPNVLVAGEPGSGKSAMVKSFLHRSVGVFGRWVAVADPKGEYGPLAEALGLATLSLRPGGTARVNPLEAGPGLDPGRRLALVGALAGTVLGRGLEPIEDAAVGWALEAAESRGGPAPTLGDLCDLLARPTAEMAARAATTPEGLALRLEAVRFALGRLLERSLRGMFDGPTTAPVDWSAPGLVVDLSALGADGDALAVVLAAAFGWLSAVLSQPQGPPRLLVLDEAWSLLAGERTARFLQACWKLGRSRGLANVAVVHRLSDLRSQAEDGSVAAKLTSGLLADTATRVVFRQAADQAGEARDLLGLTGPESELIGALVRGRALWRLGPRAAVVAHELSAAEQRLVDTDARMR